MKAKFELRPSLRPRDVPEAGKERKTVEWVEITTGRDGKDVVSRLARPEDFARFKAEYAAFKKLHPLRYPAPKK